MIKYISIQEKNNTYTISQLVMLLISKELYLHYIISYIFNEGEIELILTLYYC